MIPVAHFLKMGEVPEDAGKAFLGAILQALPELHLKLESAWKCITRIWELQITTHQYHHPVFLPEELRQEAMQ